MIRFRRLTPELLDAWLVNHGFPPASCTYRLRLWKERRANLAALLPELLAYIDEGFEDVRRRVRRGFGDDLSPFRDDGSDPSANYPAMLHRSTLKGYLGETLGSLAIEHWGAMDRYDWVVPAFLFRLHDVEFQHLEIINERLLAGEDYDPDEVAERRPGRTGDDTVAFRIDDENVITDVITVEAKCLAQHQNAKIASAHAKLAVGPKRPTAVRELINLLEDYDSPVAQLWQKALLELWRSRYSTVSNYDGFVYCCAHAPAHASRESWMSADVPHGAYTATRMLECMEFHLEELEILIDLLYRGGN